MSVAGVVAANHSFLKLFAQYGGLEDVRLEGAFTHLHVDDLVAVPRNDGSPVKGFRQVEGTMLHGYSIIPFINISGKISGPLRNRRSFCSSKKMCETTYFGFGLPAVTSSHMSLQFSR